MIFKLGKTIFLFGCLLICLFVIGCSNPANDLVDPVKPSPTFPGVSTIPTETATATNIPAVQPTNEATDRPGAEEPVAVESDLMVDPTNTVPPKFPTLTPTAPVPTAPPLPEIDEDASQFPWLNFTNQTTEEQVFSSAALPKIGTPVPETRFYLSPDNLDQLTELAVWGKGVIHDAVYSPDGQFIYATTDLGLYVYDAETAEQVNFRPIASKIKAITFLPANNQIALSLELTPPTVELLDAQTLETVQVLRADGETAPIRLQVSTDGTLLVATFDSKTSWVKVWETKMLETILSRPLSTMTEGSSQDVKVAFAADSKELFFLDRLEVIKWEFGEYEYKFVHKTGLLTDYDFEWQSRDELSIIAFEVSPDGKQFATAQYWDDRILVINSQTGDLEFEFYARDKALTHTARAYLSKTAGLSKIAELSGPGVHTTSQIRFTADSNQIAVASYSLVIEMWSLETQARMVFLDNVGNQVVLAPDDRFLAGIKDNLTQWRVADGEYRNVLKQHIGRITDLQFVPNSNNLAISADDGFVYLRSLRDGGLVASLKGYNENLGYFFNPSVSSIDLTADGKLLISGGSDSLKFWNLEDFSVKDLQPAPQGQLLPHNVAISDDGSFVATSQYDQAVRIWAMNPTAEMEPAHVCFSPTNIDLNRPLLISCGDICSAHFTSPSLDFLPNHSFMLACSQPDRRDNWGFQIWDQPLINESIVSLADREIHGVEASKDGLILLGYGRQEDKVNGRYNNFLYVWKNSDLNFELVHLIPISFGYRPYYDVLIDNQNKYMGIAGRDLGLLFFDLKTGELIHHLPHVLNPVSIDVSPDGRLIAIGTEAGTVHLWGVP